jgi:hypothetical protein
MNDAETENRKKLQRISASLDTLLSWVESRNFKGYEPFDALLSPLSRLALGRPFAQRLFIQLVRQSPVNLRPLLGIRPHESSMGMGCMAAGYLNLYCSTRMAKYKERAVDCLNWLIQNKSPYFKEFCWGHHFDWVSRAGSHPKGMPTIVWTSLIGHTFLDAYEILNDRRFLEIAGSIVQWILKLPREQTDSGFCISYVHFRQDSIHNSNMLGASLLARYGAQTTDDQCLRVAKESMRYSCTRQLADGSWYYGEHPMHQWIDNFHTGYNLDSLKCYLQNAPEEDYRLRLEKALGFYKKSFFEESGRPKYYDKRIHPIDIQCASQAITTLVNFTEFDKEAECLAWRVAQWTLRKFQDKKGFFYYRRWPLYTVRTPMFHWGQATMFKALSQLYSLYSARIPTTEVNLGSPVSG